MHIKCALKCDTFQMLSLGELCVSISCIKLALHLFKTSLLQPEEGDTKLTAKIKYKAQTKFDSHVLLFRNK